MIAEADRDREDSVRRPYVPLQSRRSAHARACRSGGIGRLLYAHAARTGLGPIRQDVNALWDLAPHDLAILFHLFAQEPVSVSATWAVVPAGRSRGRGFRAAFLRRTARSPGSMCRGSIPTRCGASPRSATQKMVVFDDVAVDEKLRVFDKGASYEAVSESARGTEFGEYRALIRDGDITIPKLASQEPLKEQVAEFVALLRHRRPASHRRRRRTARRRRARGCNRVAAAQRRARRDRAASGGCGVSSPIPVRRPQAAVRSPSSTRWTRPSWR